MDINKTLKTKFFSKIKFTLRNFISDNYKSEDLQFNMSVDLSKINYILEKKFFKKTKFFLWDGDWDKHIRDLKEYKHININYKSIFQIFEENMDYKDSGEYKEKLKELSVNGKTNRGHSNIEELNSYFESLNKLKISLEKEGYKNQSELKKENLNDEIGVIIGRDGEIIKLDDKFGGTHRFGLCKILKINKVTINIKAVHSKFISKKKIKELLVDKDFQYVRNYLKEKIEEKHLVSNKNKL